MPEKNTIATTNSSNSILQFWKHLFLCNRFFYVMFGIAVLFIFGFIFPWVFEVAQFTLFAFVLVTLLDMLLLFKDKKALNATRVVPEKFSNGDPNTIELQLKSNYPIDVTLEIIDELPEQFQKRDFSIIQQLKPREKTAVSYSLTPKQRGEYHFGALHLFVSSKLGIAMRRFSIETPHMVKTYPGFLQLKKFELLSFNSSNLEYGIKKIRKIGNSFEFEQIKDYVQGDNIKDINWKATAKRNQLMVNQYQDEKSQQVYSIIDKGRVMKMPFEGLSLLDYAINASLVISNVVLRKSDKAGLFSFSRKPENFVVAERRNSQMNLILESLYNVATNYDESDFGGLYNIVKRKITHRSLLLLYTNFESIDAVHRQMNYLRAINKSHLLVVVFFKNTELEHMRTAPTDNVQGIFDRTIAEKFSYEKRLIVAELQKYGIQTILTEPQNLTINAINKYLEIKAKGFL